MFVAAPVTDETGRQCFSIMGVGKTVTVVVAVTAGVGAGDVCSGIAYKVLVNKSNGSEYKTAMHQILFLYVLNGKLT